MAAFRDFIDTHDISGITAVDDTTLRFTLLQPAGDVVNILALPFSSAASADYLNYLPDDANFHQHTITDGPYAITAYVLGQSYVPSHNPARQESADPLRHQYVGQMQITLGADENSVQQQIAAGTQDLEWDTTVPTADVPALPASGDPRMCIYANHDSNPFLVFNLQSPAGGGRTYGPGSTDLGDYDNAAVNADIDEALSTTDQTTAAAALHAADVQIMKDAPIIPIQRRPPR